MKIVKSSQQNIQFNFVHLLLLLFQIPIHIFASSWDFFSLFLCFFLHYSAPFPIDKHLNRLFAVSSTDLTKKLFALYTERKKNVTDNLFRGFKIQKSVLLQQHLKSDDLMELRFVPRNGNGFLSSSSIFYGPQSCILITFKLINLLIVCALQEQTYFWL